MKQDFSDAEVYLAIKSAFMSLKGLSENSLKKQGYQGQEKAVQTAMGKLEALIKAPKKTIAEYAKNKAGIADAIIADIEPILGASGDHDLYVLYNNYVYHIMHWYNDRSKTFADKIMKDAKHLAGVLDLQNSNMFVRPIKKFFQKFQR